jgi:predicted Zn-dependent peptidase
MILSLKENMSHTITQLPNGLWIVAEEMRHTHSVWMGIFTKVGSRHEPARLSGISHFLEHMFFKGTERRSAKQVSEAIEGIGGSLNASTSYDATVYFAKVANIHFHHAVDTLSDMLLNSLFDAREIEKERRVIIEEINMSLDQPSDWVHQLLDEALWGKQPLGRDIAGTAKTVAGITRNDLLLYKERHYTLPNTVISVAGNLPSEVLVEAWSKAFEHYTPGARQQPQPTIEPKPGPRVSLMTKATEQANFCLGLPAVSYLDPDRRPLQVLNSTILGGSMSSRLFQEIREERGLAYSVFSDIAEYDDAGKWVIYAGVEVGKIQDAITAVIHELRKLRGAVASRNGSHILRYGKVIPVEQVVAEIEAVTREDVLRVANRLIRPEALVLAVIGPYKSKAPFRRLLEL